MGSIRETERQEDAAESSTIEIPTHPHNGKKIDKLIVSQYIDDDPYVVTYSKEDNSIHGWLINIEENGQQQPYAYFKLDEPYEIDKFVIYKKILVFFYENSHVKIIGLNGSEGRFLQLELHLVHLERTCSIGFLPNGDLISIIVNGNQLHQICLYSFAKKPKNDETPWAPSQKYHVESLNECIIEYFIYQTKLFIFNEGLMTQWDLLTMTFEMKYNLVGNINKHNYSIVINKNQTLLALRHDNDKKFDIYSMRTGLCISRYDSKECISAVEFVTLIDGSEELLIFNVSDRKYKISDPFHPFDAIDVTNDITNDITNDTTDDDITNIIIITKSNKKFYTKENNVWVTDGLNENTFQQIPNNTSNFYILPIFKPIQGMLKSIKDKVYCEFPEDYMIKLEDSDLFRFNLVKIELVLISKVSTLLIEQQLFHVEIKGFKKLQNNDEWKETQNTITLKHRILSYKQLNNQNLALITRDSMYIYTIVDDLLKLRYKIYYGNIQKVLDNEFDDSISSLPSPTLSLYGLDDTEFKEFALRISEDPFEFSKFGSVILNVAKHREYDDIVQLVFDKIMNSIEKGDYDYTTLLPFSLELPKLCDNHHSSLVMKYILHTSILLDPHCSSVKNLNNTSLHAYSKNIYIKKEFNILIRLIIVTIVTITIVILILTMLAFLNYIMIILLGTIIIYIRYFKGKKAPTTPTIRFIVPFPQICKYRRHYKGLKRYEGYNSWNEMLYKPKSILFCNIDSNNFYKWWNFAAIIDFKWKTFGIYYHFLIWLFYTIFFICFALATTLDLTDYYRKILFIISILLGFIHLTFEIRQFFWKAKAYFNDLFNLFDVGAYSLPIIASVYWIIHGSLPPCIAKDVYPFLVVLFLIILGFAHAFFILLRFENDDRNNPWNLTTEYNSFNPDGTINPNPTLVQAPDSNTNMFNNFSTSLLAMYLFLAGNSGSISSWSYLEDPAMTFLLFVFTFFMVIYLMNLFIGLLNISIENYNKDEEFLYIKAQTIMEIELFYMLPCQRYKKEWFPDWIYYDMPVNEVRKLIDAIDNNKTEFNTPPFTPFISKRLRDLVGISVPTKPVNEEKFNELQELIINLTNQTSE